MDNHSNNNNININNQALKNDGQQHQVPLHHHTHHKYSEFIANLSQFFQRDLISIPLIKKYAHNQLGNRCGLKAATLELDTAAYPNIEYIAGNRLNVYPINPSDHVQFILKHVVDDITGPRTRKQSLTDQWSKFVQLNGKDSLKMALLYLYDITTAPSRDLLRILAEACSKKDHRDRLIHLSQSDDTWEKWICSSLRTLKSTLEEFNSCSISAKALFSELTLQQPRQYSISSIKSSKRFRTEIIVIQHRFSISQIAITLQNMKDRDGNEKSTSVARHQQDIDGPKNTLNTIQSHPTSVRLSHNEPLKSPRSSASVRSLRSIMSYGVSPIKNQQVRKVPTYSGPLMSKYVSASTIHGLKSGISSPDSRDSGSRNNANRRAQKGPATKRSRSDSVSTGSSFDGLCSNYLLNLNSSEFIVCELVENPRFTLKGNRERPIMMIGQDVGLLAFRAFWQQRGSEHDRAQVFYSLFRDLPPKKFGEIQLVCLTGSQCKVEDLLKHSINYQLTRKILSSVLNIDRKHLISLMDRAAIVSNVNDGPQIDGQAVLTIDRELVELGNRMSRLLLEDNGCLYTCCDQQMTQAIEILIIECVILNHPSLARYKVINLLNKWKGNSKQNLKSSANGKKVLYTFENPFERAQVVQEIYDQSI